MPPISNNPERVSMISDMSFQSFNNFSIRRVSRVATTLPIAPTILMKDLQFADDRAAGRAGDRTNPRAIVARRLDKYSNAENSTTGKPA